MSKASKPERHRHPWRLQKLGWLGVLMMLTAVLWWALDHAGPKAQKAWSELSASMGLSSSTTMSWQLAFEPQTPQATATPELDPEPLVRQIYAQLGEGERAQALATASVLAERFPTFQLGQLLYADLLNISSANPVPLPFEDEENAPSLRKRLDELILESKRRLQRDSAQSLQGKIPAALAFLSPQQAYVAAVDASKSRLYWFENRSGPDGRLQLHLVKESYISVGINGVGKNQEGDGKTPLGVYFIQRNLPGEGLPDLFGEGALTLNYPNAVDVMRKKTGSGIWLHGTPSAQYARAPESTDGCVVLANPEMRRLLHMPDLRMTPVIIAEQLEWVNADQAAQTWAGFKPALNQWLQARNGRDPEALKIHYSPRYEQDGVGLAQVWPRLAQTTLGYSQTKPLELVSVLNWKDQDHTMVVTMKDPNQSHPQGAAYLRTYWQKENGQWRLVFQGPT
ncbi:L,D-transpeptidase family protein [Limnohabitans sp.]|uniref:L,D-transpeptidase family protein n=1 Tax=Limnohabitans sp. TaxID=1907725 RepID=UPI0025BDEAD1|nr:L,D-transpeptidase family protein [Limnohabitans sp.]